MLLDVDLTSSSQTATCPVCASAIEIDAFPALFRGPQSISEDDLSLHEGAASCFYHTTKRAADSCTRCGKFLCSLCSLEVLSESWCADCLTSGTAEKSVPGLVARRTLWDTIALGFAVIPTVILPLFYFWIFTAPLAIFLSIGCWKKPSSLVPRTKIRFILAIAIALVQMAAIVFVIYAIFRVRLGGTT
jgi:hypothetical protein